MLYFLNSALTIVLALFFFLTGILSFLLPFSSSAQEAAVSLIQSHFWVWILFGFGSFLIGSAFATYTYFINRKNYLTTKSGPYTTSISESVIQSYLQNYFEMLFPKTQIPYRLLLKKKKIQIIADLPCIPQDEQKNLLATMEKDLSELLYKNLGYHQTLELTLSFDSK